MLQPHQPAKPPQTRYIRQAEPARVPAPVLALKTLGEMRPAVACTLIVATTGLAVGAIVAIVALVAAVVAAAAAVASMVAIASVSLAVIVLALRAGPPSPRRP
jgi:hypothetical protein